MSLRVHPERAAVAPLVDSLDVALQSSLTIALLGHRDRGGGEECEHNRQQSQALHNRRKGKRRAATPGEEYSAGVQNFSMASRLLSSLACHV